ncbi:uncharacterized protein LOC129319432 [Prosopis cineraria]|uniref:uncharacterized protein LOC129319432 n=1 Tax=Prosopis cineraria TaxID=364024 RepID=UPI00240FB26E|nr:uncharacterized protein LOC129319432 [Prosopis cineraria]
MSSSSLTLLTLLLLLAFTLFPSSQSEKADADDMIDRICKKTPFFDLCSATLHANPLTPKADLKAIALVVLKDILLNATETLSHIESLIRHTSDRRLEQSLAFCGECYIPIIKYTLPQAADAVSHGQFGFAAYCVGYTEKEVLRCERKLAWSKNSSSLENQNGVVHKLAGVASAIIRLLLKA